MELGNTIDQGEFGEVHLATYRSMQVAVKTINEAKQSAAALSSLLREAAVMTYVDVCVCVCAQTSLFSVECFVYVVTCNTRISYNLLDWFFKVLHFEV